MRDGRPSASDVSMVRPFRLETASEMYLRVSVLFAFGSFGLCFAIIWKFVLFVFFGKAVRKPLLEVFDRGYFWEVSADEY